MTSQLRDMYEEEISKEFFPKIKKNAFSENVYEKSIYYI